MTILIMVLSFTASASSPLPPHLYSVYTINDFDFEGCTTDYRSIYRVDIGGTIPDYTNYVRMKWLGSPLNGGYAQLAAESNYNDRDPSVFFYYSILEKTRYIAYGSGDGTVVELETNFYKGADQYSGPTSWKESRGYDLKSQVNFDYNNQCAYVPPPPVPATPTITDVTIYETCFAMANVKVNAPANTEYYDISNRYTSDVIWSGTATSVTFGWNTNFVKARACNVSGCSNYSAYERVGTINSKLCGNGPL